MSSLPPNITAILQQAAQEYGANPNVLKYMTQYESGGRNSVNNWDSNAKAGTPSAGILQFIQPTFNAYAKQAQAANPNAWRGVNSDWRDPQAQALATAWAITHGKGSAWSTYSRALQSAGGNATGVKVPGMAGPSPAMAQPQQPAFDWSTVSSDPVIQKILAGGSGSRSAPAPALNGMPGGGNPGGNAGGVVGIAASQVGKLANAAGSWLKANGVPFDSAWCGDFVAAVFKQAGLKPPPSRSVPQLLSWAQSNHTFAHQGASGNEVLFDWNHDGVPDHVGLVESVGGGKLHEIGGNQRTQGTHGVTRDTFNLNDPSILGYVNYGGR